VAAVTAYRARLDDDAIAGPGELSVVDRRLRTSRMMLRATPTRTMASGDDLQPLVAELALAASGTQIR